MAMMHSTSRFSGRPRSLAMYCVDVVPSLKLFPFICAQRLPRPSAWAAYCMVTAAMEQSSTHSPEVDGSPHTTTATGASLTKAAPPGFATESSFRRVLSVTTTNSHGLLAPPVGERRAASMMASIFPGSTGRSAYTLTLLLFSASSLNIFPLLSLQAERHDKTRP